MQDQTPDQTPEAAAPETTEPTVQLQLADLVLAVQVIQLASSRAAFKTEEFTQVGGVYERIVKFLQASGAIQPSTAEQTDGTSSSDAPAA